VDPLAPKIRVCELESWYQKQEKPSVLLDLLLLRSAFLTNGNFDALRRECFAERRALDHSGEFLGREDLEGIGVGPGEHGAFLAVEAGVGGGIAEVDEVHFESVARVRFLVDGCKIWMENSPEPSFSADRKILQNEPVARFVLCVVEQRSVDRQTSNKVASVHGIRRRLDRGLLLVLGHVHGRSIAHAVRRIIVRLAVLRREHHGHRLAELVEHCALLWWREGSHGSSADADCRGRRRGADDIDLARGIPIPEIDLQDEEAAFNGVGIDLLAGVFVGDY
jgi:hypothetical protein